MRTDLAKESTIQQANIEGIREEIEQKDGAEILRIDVLTGEAAEKLDKPIGRYVTLTAAKTDMMDRMRRAALAKMLADELRNMTGNFRSAMVIGLGNRYVAADALGTKTAEHVFVTRHIHAHMKELLPEGTPVVSAFCANVLGVTGMETVEVVSALSHEIRPDLVILIDSLAASRIEHLGCVIQCNDSGIAPGAGVGNFRSVLSEETLHIPVLAIGVPLVVSAETILEGFGCDTDKEEDLKFMIVAPKEIDAMVKDASRVLADGINLALFGDNYTELEKLLR
jgi:spore protease